MAKPESPKSDSKEPQTRDAQIGKTFEYPIEFRIRHKDAPIQVYMIGLFSEEDPAMISGFPASLEELRAVRPPDVCMGIFPGHQPVICY